MQGQTHPAVPLIIQISSDYPDVTLPFLNFGFNFVNLDLCDGRRAINNLRLSPASPNRNLIASIRKRHERFEDLVAMAASVDAKLLRATKFPVEFNQKVDFQKVNLQVMKK